MYYAWKKSQEGLLCDNVRFLRPVVFKKGFVCYWHRVLSFMKLREAYSLPPSCIFLLCDTKMAHYRPNLADFHTPTSFSASLLIS